MSWEDVVSALGDPAMELIQLLSFYQIVKTESFSKASKHIFRSQSAVSHQIKNLEKELNIKLFERLGRKIRLTEEGKLLCGVISSFVNDLDNVKRTIEDMHQCFGSLTIAASSAIITYILPNIIRMFVEQFSGVKFKLITCAVTSEIQPMVMDGNADFGIGPRFRQLLPQRLNFLFWKSFDKVLITSKNHPLSKKRNLKLLDITKSPLILYREGTVIRKDVEEAFFSNKLPYETIMELDVAESIKKYVEIGIGISILSSLTLTNEDKGRFCCFNVNSLFGRTNYGIYYRKDKYITSSMRQFITFFAPELSDKFLST